MTSPRLIESEASSLRIFVPRGMKTPRQGLSRSTTMRPYRRLHIYELSDEISVKGDAFGPDFIGCWNEAGSSFLFFSRNHDEVVRRWLAHQGRGKLISRHVMDYRDWQGGEDLKPFRVEKLVICPSWEEAEAAEDEILIRLDPGVVFGTGLHPTTRGCLKALWRIYQADPPGMSWTLERVRGY